MNGLQQYEDRAMLWTVVGVILLTAFALFGCAGQYGLDDVAPIGESGELVVDPKGSIEVVQGSDYCASIQCLRFAPWFRIGTDAVGDVRWLISSTWRACLVNDAQFTLANSWVRRKVRCAWRSARPG